MTFQCANPSSSCQVQLHVQLQTLQVHMQHVLNTGAAAWTHAPVTPTWQATVSYRLCCQINASADRTGSRKQQSCFGQLIGDVLGGFLALPDTKCTLQGITNFFVQLINCGNLASRMLAGLS